ncbi:hypothetical protein P350_34115 [Burkholderia cepacia JBK9]|uniref:Uncharacterized protein n=1 Tax=Burkholderia arboris TaxID=488730 RepID=A0A9Q9SGP0_9BURK|nr:hypothetical protein [Burkholderia arboris]ALX16686.1 hypothetical protein P350_34115 [Burkholderia cepacia JBK9]MCA8489460.1 hypothetical protein [Burkholderia arboris]UTV60558.1 hypothetical protein NLX30_35860 [Burkholderia arboris]VWB47452.1 hypothetical protein BAR24066_02141 [Burkholderia arboris]
MMFRHPPGPGPASEPDADPALSGIPATLPDSGVVVNVRGVAYVIKLPPRDHARPALWRELADWRDERSVDGDIEPAARQD